MGRNKIFKSLLLAIMSVWIISCDKSSRTVSNADLLKRGSDNVQQLISSKETIEINLDNVTENLVINDSLLTNEAVMKVNGNEQFLLSSPMDIIALADKILVLDDVQNCVYQTDLIGKIERKMLRYGKGPGELNRPYFIDKNDEYFVIYDNNNNRVQFFDKSFRYVKSINYAILPIGNNICLSNKYLFVNSDPNILPKKITTFRIDGREKSKVYFIDSTFAINDKIDKAAHFYDYKMASNKENILVAVMSFLPYGFIFDSTGRVNVAIKFSGQFVDNLANIEGVDLSYNRLYLKNFINDVIQYEKYIIFYIGDLLVVLEKSNNAYKIYKLNKNISGVIAYTKNHLFIADIFNAQIYKTDVPLK